MDVIEATRNLGRAIQKDERFIAYARAKLANDRDEELQNGIGQFNLIRMQLDEELNSDNKDEEKVQKLNEELRSVYSKVMSGGTMVEYNTAKVALDGMINDINSMIMSCVEGDDPETVEPHASGCSGSCESCGGCH